jgi:hypothetical protein
MRLYVCRPLCDTMQNTKTTTHMFMKLYRKPGNGRTVDVLLLRLTMALNRRLTFPFQPQQRPQTLIGKLMNCYTRENAREKLPHDTQNQRVKFPPQTEHIPSSIAHAAATPEVATVRSATIVPLLVSVRSCVTMASLFGSPAATAASPCG